MNKFKIAGAATIALAELTLQDWLFILSIIITVIGMVQDYLHNKEEHGR